MKSLKFYESGQSLVEMLFILPIFFMILAGFIFIFQNQMRIFSDESAQSSLMLSESYFDYEEKQQAHWASAKEDSIDLIKKQTEQSLNPSSFFKKSVDMKNGVFLDKKPIKRHEQIQSCSAESLYQVLLKENGRFELTTCASSSSYENLESSFDPNYKAEPQSYSGYSLYFPQNEFIWSHRQFAAAYAALSFSQSAQGNLYSKQQASLSLPDKSNFNTNCFMQPFEPQCSIEPVAKIFSRTAKDSSKLQISLCYSEAALACAPTGPALPACLAAKLSQIINALELGVESWVCPNTNTALKASQNRVRELIFAYSSIIFNKEVAFRSEILINNAANKKN